MYFISVSIKLAGNQQTIMKLNVLMMIRMIKLWKHFKT